MHEPDYPALIRSVTTSLASLQQSQPATMQAFGALGKASMTSGALSDKQKELIALGIAVSARCAGCIGFHVKAVRRLGVTRAEFDEALGVAVYMGGGPSLMYAAEAIQAWEQFEPAA